jgi:FkbM family methyltransferase
MRRRLVRTLDSTGLGGQARWVHQRVSPLARRNRIDNEHQRLLMAFCLAADANCVDAGAHRGVVLREMLRCAPLGRHIAFEPLPALAAELRRSFPEVDVRDVALSDASGSARFVHVSSNPEMSGLREREYGGPQEVEHIEVQTQRLDDALPPGYVPALLKIDVEGAELLVLQGALGTLRAHRPIVMFEHGIGGADRYGSSSRDVYLLLTAEAGLRIFDIDGGGPYSEGDFVAMFSRPLWTWVAHR